jgi:hypothetical protein
MSARLGRGEPGVTEHDEYLDPTDWRAFRQTGHAIFDELVDLLQTVSSRPVWQAVPDPAKAQVLAGSLSGW